MKIFHIKIKRKKEKNMETATKRILNLMEERSIKGYQLELAVKLASGTISSWKSGKCKPSAANVAKIANYFGVSTDYLLGSTDESTPYQSEAITIFEEIGTVKAGYDGLAVEEPTGKKIEIPTSMLLGRKKEEFFTLRVSGNSMYPRLLEGDTILCLRCTSVDSGSLAVVLYNGDEATVKKVVYEKGEDWVDLIPFNPEFSPRRVSGADLQNCRILGKVIKLIRDL